MYQTEVEFFLDYLDGKFPVVFGVSIDKVSLMGNWCYWKGKHPFQKLVNLPGSPISINKGNNTPEAEGFIFNKIWFKTTDKRKFKDVRDFKLEFNPKRLNSNEEEYLKEKILPLMRHVGFTRLDFAFDVDADLSDYIYYEGNNPKKIGKYFGKNGNLETMYIGSRESEWHVCIYNKKKKKMKELLKEERAVKNGVDYLADLTDWEREQLEKREHWWRIEIRVRRDKATPEISEDDLFQSLHIFNPCLNNAKRIQDQALLYYLINFPEKLKEMNYRTKQKAKALILNASEFDLITVLRFAFGHHRPKLEKHLKSYLSASSLQLYDIEQLYTVDEKISMLSGVDIETNNLTFSSNIQLKKFHILSRQKS